VPLDNHSSDYGFAPTLTAGVAHKAVEHCLNRQGLESAWRLWKTAGRAPIVSRPELDVGFRPNGDGSISVELYVVLPGMTFGQLIHGEAQASVQRKEALSLTVVASKNSESGEKSRVSRFTTVMSPRCSSSCITSFLYSSVPSENSIGTGT
jgi:hypothetical protein